MARPAPMGETWPATRLSTLTGFDRIAESPRDPHGRRADGHRHGPLDLGAALDRPARPSKRARTCTRCRRPRPAATGFAAATTTAARRRAVNRASAQLRRARRRRRACAPRARRSPPSAARSRCRPAGRHAARTEARGRRGSGSRSTASAASERAATAATLADVSLEAGLRVVPDARRVPRPARRAGRALRPAADHGPPRARGRGRQARPSREGRRRPIRSPACATGARSTTISRARSRRAASASSCSTSTGSSRRTSGSATRSATSASAPSRRRCARPIATAPGYRLGGDEFAAILAGVGADAGHRFAHRVQDAMRVQHGGDGPSVAVGVAVGDDAHADERPDAPRRHRAARRQAHDLADPRALPRARHRHARDARRAQAGRPRRRARGRGRRQGRRRLRPQRHRRRARGRHRRAASAWRASRSTRCAWPGSCTTSATSTSTTRSSPRTSRRPTRSGSRSPRTPSAARASSSAAASARSRPGSATTTSAWTARAIPTASPARSIPLESRILHVADAYEAMTRGHSYQPRMTAEAALAELERLAGSQFDPQLRRGAAAQDRRDRARRPDADRSGVDRDVPGLGRDARDPGLHRGDSDRGRSRPRRPRACSRRARCRRCSAARRRSSRVRRRGASPSRPARACRRRGAPGSASAYCSGVRRVLRARSARRRCSARGRTARRTSTAAPAPARRRPPARSACRRPRYHRIAPDSPSGRPSSSTSVGTRSAGFRCADEIGAIGAVDDVERVALERQAEVRGQEADLVAVARDGRVVEDHASDDSVPRAPPVHAGLR